MSKIIAVWGSPNSGKTTFSAKLSCAIYERYNSTVLMFSTDMKTPVLPVLFPNKKADELSSIGVPLAKTEVTQNDLIKSIVTIKEKMNFGVLGFKDGENKYSYPSFDIKKTEQLLTVMQELADVIVIDCSNDMDVLSKTAIQKADEVIRLAAPDLKSIAFYASQFPIYAEPSYKTDQHIVGINTTESDCYLPLEDVKAHFGGVSFVLPYCREIKQQMFDGELLKTVADKKYNAKLKTIADKVV